MSDASSQTTERQQGGGVRFPFSLREAQATLARGDIALAIGIVTILSVLMLPMPTWLLDASLALSITFSVMILMTVLFIEKPLEFSAFPTVLLIATMLRLSLNVASTRLILANGHEGTDAAGRVIEAFGEFMMGGNFVIGVIVFAILVLVNFIVITKGSGRIAEVTARFTLDAMPGKQMAIDADLSSGLIDEAEAKRRRSELEGESNFYGAMDGASKYVRGDAIAGLIITFINVLAGILIGTMFQDVSVSEATRTYTILTVGDGLVSQIPALIVSTAAGILVTKSTIRTKTDKPIFQQISSYPAALIITAMLLVALSLFPGIPMLPFLALAGALGSGAYFLNKRQTAEVAAQERRAEAARAMPPSEEPISTALQMDLIRLELGYGLLPMINATEGPRVTEQIKALRRQLASEMGFIMPSVRIQDNLELPANTYVVRVKEIEAGKGDLNPGQLLVMDPRGEPITLPGEETVEPTFGLPAMWVAGNLRDEAMFRGYTVVDPPTVITTHLTEVVKDHMPELLSYSETQKLLDELGGPQQKLVGDLIPSQVTLGAVQRVLQTLLAERISIRDLPTILEGIAEACAFTRNVSLITEHVRTRLARQISEANAGPDGVIALVTLSPDWEQAFAESIIGEGEERQLSMAPSRLQEFITSIRQTFERLAAMGESPALLTSPAVRPFVRSIIERFRPSTVVMSQNEIHAKARIRTLGQI